jgi:hypothetical protein
LPELKRQTSAQFSGCKFTPDLRSSLMCGAP